MFSRYWRAYPSFLQIILFGLMVFTFTSLGLYVIGFLPKFSGVSIHDIQTIGKDSTPKIIRISLLFAALGNIFMFAIPSLLFAYFTHPKPAAYLGLRKPGKPIHWLLVTGIMLGLLPVFISLESLLTAHLHLGKWADDMQQENDRQFAAFLQLNSVADTLLLFIALAVIPAFGEELFFRGTIMRFAHRGGQLARPVINLTGNLPSPAFSRQRMVFSILITSVFFGLMHFNPYGFISIFAAAVVLALIYWYTGSLLCSMLGHLLHNGSQILIVVLMHHYAAGNTAVENNNLPWYLPLAGFVLFLACGYGLLKHKTPLRPDWSNDFNDEQ